MSYALTTLWYERSRYLPAILAVAFSALLMALQFGLLFGLFSITSMPVDCNTADVWMGAPEVKSVDLGRPIRGSYVTRMQRHVGIERSEVYMQGFAYWSRRDGGTELCMVIGSRMTEDSLGAVSGLPQHYRDQLSMPGTVVIDESDKSRLGVKRVGETFEVSGTQVRVIGFTQGIKSLAGPYVFCSLTTAKPLLRMLDDQVTYVLGKCKNPEEADAVAADLQKRYPELTVYPANNFSFQSKSYWLRKTKAGIALGYAAVLGLMVGAVVTYQTLYAATAASLRELAVLRALGIPRWRMAMMVVSQAFWVGIIGITLAIPTIFVLAEVANFLGVKVLVGPILLSAAGGVTMTMAILSGLLAMRSLRHVEPATLLR